MYFPTLYASHETFNKATVSYYYDGMLYMNQFHIKLIWCSFDLVFVFDILSQVELKQECVPSDDVFNPVFQNGLFTS